MSDEGDREAARRVKPSLIDVTVPNAARAADYLYGGQNNFEADRRAARALAATAPVIVDIAPAVRGFQQRVLRFLVAAAGVTQFLDIGTSLPLVGSTHEVAQALVPESRIAYVDNDPMVLSHARALMKSAPGGVVGYVDADVREPGAIVASARQRLLEEAQRLFRERGYAATSLEQIAEAAEVTKGAIYGHFASKEDLMISALEAAPAPDYSATLNDESRPLPERLAAYGRAVAAEQPGDTEEVAVYLEFYAALLRSPDALQRYAGSRERRLRDLAEADDADDGDLAAEATQVDAWVIGQAMLVGLQIYKRLAPGLVTPELFERAFGLLAGLYQEP